MTHSPKRSTKPANRSRWANPEAQARALGWVSIGLGLAEFLMPNAMARAIGQPGQAKLLRWYGLREIATGAGLLMAKDPTPWVWARVGGDALDLVTLGSGLAAGRLGTDVPRSAAAIVAVIGVTAADAHCAIALTAENAARQRRVEAYGGRRGFPLPADEMRGAALVDFVAPADMVTPMALRPYTLN